MARSEQSTQYTPAPGFEPQIYTVQSGDTGYAIAAAHRTTFKNLEKMNPGVEWTNLQVGQLLNVPVADAATTPVRPLSPVLDTTNSATGTNNTDGSRALTCLSPIPAMAT